MAADTLAERLAAGEAAHVAAEPATIVIFGGAGDLAHRKLLPALYNLHLDGLLPPRIAVVGAGRNAFTDEAYRAFAREGVERFSRRPMDEAQWPAFAERCSSSPRPRRPARVPDARRRLDTIEHERGLPGNRIYYLAVPSIFCRPS